MKLQTLLILLFVTAYFYSLGQNRRVDTTFLFRENSNGIYHAIFVDENKASKSYKQIADFTFYNYDQESYSSSLRYLRDKHFKLIRKVITKVPKKWIPLYQYKNKFYLYYPCDFYFHFKSSITDTSFITTPEKDLLQTKYLTSKLLMTLLSNFT